MIRECKYVAIRKFCVPHTHFCPFPPLFCLIDPQLFWEVNNKQEDP